MSERRRNWLLWAGFAVCLLAFASYFLFFVRFPVTRDVPWVNLLLFAIGLLMLGISLRRAFARPKIYRGKVVGSILGGLGLALAGFFCVAVFALTRELPKSAGAPQVGEKAPEFVLPDTNNKPVSLSSLLSDPFGEAHKPPRGVLLIFYRGYW